MTHDHALCQCFNCRQFAVAWQADFDFEDFGIFDRKGIVHVCECRNCGAEIEYYCEIKENNNDQTSDKQ